MWQFDFFVSLSVCTVLALAASQEINPQESVGDYSSRYTRPHLAVRGQGNPPQNPPQQPNQNPPSNAPSSTLEITSLTYYGRSEPGHVQTYSDTIYYTTTETATVIVARLAAAFGGVTPFPTVTAWDTQVVTTTDYREVTEYTSTSTVIQKTIESTPVLVTTHKVITTNTIVPPETSFIPISRALSQINTPPYEPDGAGKPRSRHNINRPNGDFDDWYSVKIRDDGFFFATNTGYPVSVVASSTVALTISVATVVVGESSFTAFGPQGVTTLRYRGNVRTTTTTYPYVDTLRTAYVTSTVTETRYYQSPVTQTDYNINTVIAGPTPLYYEACNEDNALTQIDDRVVTAIAWRQDYQLRSVGSAYDCCVECINREDCAANFWVKPSKACYLLPPSGDQMCDANNIVAEYDIGELDDYDFFRFTLGNGYCGKFNGEPPIGCNHPCCRGAC